MKRVLIFSFSAVLFLFTSCGGSSERHAKKSKHHKTGKVDTGCHCEVWN